MLGAVAGDVIGSVYEHRPIKHKAFELFSPSYGGAAHFTDDTVLTVAVARVLLEGGLGYQDSLRVLGQEHLDAGYGGRFLQWLRAENASPYYSWGNGSAMRVSPVGLVFGSQRHPEAWPELEAALLEEARRSASVTHNHPEGIKGAQAVALGICLARRGQTKEAIRERLENRFSYDLQRSLAEIRPSYSFDVSCAGSVPEAILCFLESDSVEDAIRNAVSLGGDSDTQACIAGALAEAFYGGLPPELLTPTLARLPEDFVETLRHLYARFWPEHPRF